MAHLLGVGCAAIPVGPGADSDWKARGLRTRDGRAEAWAWAFGPRVLIAPGAFRVSSGFWYRA